MNADDISEDSDDDFLPDLHLPFSRSSINPVKKSINELLDDTISLKRDCQTDRMVEEKAKADMESYQLSSTPEQAEEIIVPSPPSEVVEKIELKLFCVQNHLQYFNIRDVTLQSCGCTSNMAGLTEFEKLLISSKPVNIENVLSTIVSVLNSGTNAESCCSHSKPFVYYLLKMLSVHEQEATVQACEQVLRTFLNNQSGITFSCAEIFVILFNYGVEIKNWEVLETVPDQIEKPSKSYSCLSGIPSNWLYNIEILLCVIEKLIFNSFSSDEDLSTIIKYFLWMYLDASIQEQYPVISQLRICIALALDTISEEKWPDSFSALSRFVMSVEKISLINCWHNIYQICKFIPTSTRRGCELQKHISFTCLNKLLGHSSQNEPSSPDTEYSLSDLLCILESIHTIETQSFHIALKLVDICIGHLKLESKEEHEDLCNCLKMCEQNFSKIKVGTFEEQEHLVRIHCRIQLMAPDLPSEMALQIKNMKIESDVDHWDFSLSAANFSPKKLQQIKKEPIFSDSSLGHSEESLSNHSNSSTSFTLTDSSNFSKYLESSGANIVDNKALTLQNTESAIHCVSSSASIKKEKLELCPVVKLIRIKTPDLDRYQTKSYHDDTSNQNKKINRPCKKRKFDVMMHESEDDNEEEKVYSSTTAPESCSVPYHLSPDYLKNINCKNLISDDKSSSTPINISSVESQISSPFSHISVASTDDNRLDSRSTSATFTSKPKEDCASVPQDKMPCLMLNTFPHMSVASIDDNRLDSRSIGATLTSRPEEDCVSVPEDKMPCLTLSTFPHISVASTDDKRLNCASVPQDKMPCLTLNTFPHISVASTDGIKLDSQSTGVTYASKPKGDCKNLSQEKIQCLTLNNFEEENKSDAVCSGDPNKSTCPIKFSKQSISHFSDKSYNSCVENKVDDKKISALEEKFSCPIFENPKPVSQFNTKETDNFNSNNHVKFFSFDPVSEAESRIHPSIRSNEFSYIKSTKLTTSVTLNSPSSVTTNSPSDGAAEITSNQAFRTANSDLCNLVISSDIEINPTDSPDQIPDIRVTFSASHVPVEDLRSNLAEKDPFVRDSSISDDADVYILKLQNGKNPEKIYEEIQISDDDVEILELPAKRTKEVGNNNLPSKRAKLHNIHDGNSSSQTTKTSIPIRKNGEKLTQSTLNFSPSKQMGKSSNPSGIPSLFQFYNTCKNSSTLPSKKTNESSNHSSKDEESEVTVVFSTEDEDDCQIISEFKEVITLD